MSNSAGPRAQALVAAAPQSFVEGWQQAMGVGVAVRDVLFFCVLARGPQKGSQK